MHYSVVQRGPGCQSRTRPAAAAPARTSSQVMGPSAPRSREGTGGEISDGLGAMVDGCPADLLEALGGVEPVRHGIWRDEVHLADDAGVAQLLRSFEHMGVEHAPEPVSAMLRGNDHAVDVQELAEPASEPEKVAPVVVIGLRKGQQKRGRWRNEERHACR